MTWTISYRLLLLVAVPGLVLATGGGIAGWTYLSELAHLERTAEARFEEAANRLAADVSTELSRPVPAVEYLAAGLGGGWIGDDDDAMAARLASMLMTHPDVSWFSVARPDGRFLGVYRTAEGRLRLNRSELRDGRTHLVELERAEGEGWRPHRVADDTGYDPRTRDFYQLAAAAPGHVWTPPYVFYEQAVPGITCAQAARGPDGALRAVVTADFDLNRLTALVARAGASPAARTFLFTADGTLLAHPSARVVVTSGQGAKGELLRVTMAPDPATRAFALAVGRPSEDDPPRTFSLDADGERYYAGRATFSPDAGLTWVVGSLSPASAVLGGLQASLRRSLAVVGVGVILALALGLFLSDRIARPLALLSAELARLGGRRAAPGKAATSRFAELAGLEDVLGSLQAEEALLAVAREIQLGMVPRDVAVALGGVVDAAARLVPAKEVGGDLYVTLPLGPERVLVALGDVSGKGVPAALFMAMASTLLRTLGREGPAPEVLIARVNDELSRDNPSCTFLTLIVAVVDVATGIVTFANGGHCPPVVTRPGAPARLVEGEQGTALGLEPGLTFARQRVRLAPGDALVLYSDGVTEAFDPQAALFGDERLLAALTDPSPLTARSLADRLLAAVGAHAAGAPQSDDIAVLVLRPAPAGVTAERLPLTLGATPEEVMRGCEAADAFARERGAPDEAARDLTLALEELLTNSLEHACARDPARRLGLRLEALAGGLRAEVRDDGPEWDPRAAPPPDLEAALEDRRVGGLGLHLVRNLVSDLDWRRDGAENVTSVVKRW